MKKKSGFTIVELLIVFFIIGLIAAIYFPQLLDIYKRIKGGN